MGVQIPSVPCVLVCTWSDSPVPAVFDGSVSNDQAIVATPAELIASVGANRIWFEGLVAGVRSSIVPTCGGSDEAPGVHELLAGSTTSRRCHPRGPRRRGGSLASTPAAEIVSAGPNAPPGERRDTCMRCLAPSERVHAMAVSGGAQRQARCACIGTGIGEVRRALQGWPGACEASWTRTFVPSVKSHAANVSPAASDATTELLGVPVAGAIESPGARARSGTPRRARRMNEQSRGEHERRMTPNTLRA